MENMLFSGTINSHWVHVVVPTVDADTPWDCDALKEEQPEEGPARGGVEIEQLEP